MALLTARDRLFLADHALGEALLHFQQPVLLALEHPADGDVRPTAHHLRDVLLVHFLLEHLAVFLELEQAAVLLLDGLLERGDHAVADFADALEVAVALFALGLGARGFELLLRLADLPDRGLFVLPVSAELRGFLLQLGEFLLDLRAALARGGVLLARERLALDLQLHPPALGLVELHRQAVHLHPQARGRLVHQVNRLVGQEAVGDVALGERGRRDEGGILDADAVVDLVALLEAAQDGDRVLDGGLADEDRLEAPFERGVLFDVLAVFVERRRADAAQLAARQGRLEQVRRVGGAFGRARADHHVQLVNEQDHRAFRLGDRLEDGLQAVLELAAELGARRSARPGRARARACSSALRARRPRRCAAPALRRWRSCRRRDRRSARGCSSCGG